jgi:hypothetical protein
VKVTYEPEFARPDLPVPLSPLHGLPALLRRCVLGLGRAGFARAYLVSTGWALATGSVALAGLLLPGRLRAPAVGCAALLGACLLARTFALMVFERRQHAFEPRWLEAQSEVLRGHEFDVLRFTVQDPDADAGMPRLYDLTRPGDVRELLHRQDDERASGAFSRATVEFAYWVGGGDRLAVGDVRRELTELTFRTRRSEPDRALIRFPEARYSGRPDSGRRPAKRTYWTLSGPVLLTVWAPA